jgi:hypothetical protein
VYLVLSRSRTSLARRPLAATRQRIPGSRFSELAGDGGLCGEIEEFITGLRPTAREQSSVMAILQCDVEGSTAIVWYLGMNGGRTSSRAMAESPTWQ